MGRIDDRGVIVLYMYLYQTIINGGVFPANKLSIIIKGESLTRICIDAKIAPIIPRE